MRVTMQTLGISCFFILSCFNTAQAQITDSHVDDRQQLLTIKDIIQKAINQQDLETIKKHLHDDVLVVFHDSEVAQGKAALQVYYDDKMSGSSAVLSGFSTQAFVDAPAQFYENTALAYGHTIDQFEFATGHVFELKSRWSASIEKQNNRWLVTSIHFSANLFDNPLLNTAKDQLFLFTGLAFLIGLILMFLISRFWFKR